MSDPAQIINLRGNGPDDCGILLQFLRTYATTLRPHIAQMLPGKESEGVNATRLCDLLEGGVTQRLTQLTNMPATPNLSIQGVGSIGLQDALNNAFNTGSTAGLDLLAIGGHLFSQLRQAFDNAGPVAADPAVVAVMAELEADFNTCEGYTEDAFRGWPAGYNITYVAPQP